MYVCMYVSTVTSHPHPQRHHHGRSLGVRTIWEHIHDIPDCRTLNGNKKVSSLIVSLDIPHCLVANPGTLGISKSCQFTYSMHFRGNVSMNSIYPKYVNDEVRGSIATHLVCGTDISVNYTVPFKKSNIVLSLQYT